MYTYNLLSLRSRTLGEFVSQNMKQFSTFFVAVALMHVLSTLLRMQAQCRPRLYIAIVGELVT
jgi:hypothetical protein